MNTNLDLIIVLCLAGIGVLAINAAIILWARRKKPLSEFQVVNQIIRAAQNPFEKSDAEYQELSSLVNNLKRQDNHQNSEGQDEQ